MIWVGLILLIIGGCIIGTMLMGRRARSRFLVEAHQVDVRLANVAREARATHQRRFGEKPADIETGKFIVPERLRGDIKPPQ